MGAGGGRRRDWPLFGWCDAALGDRGGDRGHLRRLSGLGSPAWHHAAVAAQYLAVLSGFALRPRNWTDRTPAGSGRRGCGRLSRAIPSPEPPPPTPFTLAPEQDEPTQK